MDDKLRILIADDEAIVHTTLGGYLKDMGHIVENVHDGDNALKMIEKNDYDIALVDFKMPGMDGLQLLEQAQKFKPELSVVLVTAHGTMKTVIQALRFGAADFLIKPVKLMELDIVIEKSHRLRQLRQKERTLKEKIRGIQTSEYLRNMNRKFIGESRFAKRVRESIRQAVDAKVETILIIGETGSGKEVVAREIHFQSHSDEKAFIAVNCLAMPESLMESELFGHVRGAFTGAVSDKTGFFELADQGTLFLDEIADLSLAAQAKLLRVLETRRLRKIGGTKEIHLTLRVIAATNVPLEKYIENGKFRKDLFYRLNLFPIQIPPLRERRDDIPQLAEHFLKLYALRTGKHLSGFSEKAVELLMQYDYPGNVRELQNIVERAAILSDQEMIQEGHVIIQPISQKDHIPAPEKPEKQSERETILHALEEFKWNRRKAARSLNMPYSTFRHKMLQYHIS